jgi:hypothetical protein
MYATQHLYKTGSLGGSVSYRIAYLLILPEKITVCMRISMDFCQKFANSPGRSCLAYITKNGFSILFFLLKNKMRPC